MTQIDHSPDLGKSHGARTVAVYVSAASGTSFALLTGSFLVQHFVSHASHLDWSSTLGALLFLVFGVAAMPGFVASALLANGVSGLAPLPAIVLAACAATTPLASVALLRRAMPFAGSLTDIRLGHLAMLACLAALAGTALEALPAAMAGLAAEPAPVALAASLLTRTAGGFALIGAGMAATRLWRFRDRAA